MPTTNVSEPVKIQPKREIQLQERQRSPLQDILSRAFLLEVNACEFSRELEEIDHRPWMLVGEETWQWLKNAAADDPVQQTPRTVIKRGWPDIKADVPECVYLYFDIREELTVREELIFKWKSLWKIRAHLTSTSRGVSDEQETPSSGHVWQ